MDEICNIESMEFNFPTIRVTTYNFSNVNEVGKGEFGSCLQGNLAISYSQVSQLSFITG